MREKISLVDFEIRTDSLTTRIGAALAIVKNNIVLTDLQTILPMAYHVNGSVRGKLAVTEEDLAWLSNRYDFYVSHVEYMIRGFVLPCGGEEASRLHICRSEAKKSYRALHKVSEGNACAIIRNSLTWDSFLCCCTFLPFLGIWQCARGISRNGSQMW